MKLQQLLGDYSLVRKISVSNVLTSFEFYANKIGFNYEPQYTFNSDGKFGDGSWIQLSIKNEDKTSSICLFSDSENAGSETEIFTIDVQDITQAKQSLEDEGIIVGNIDKTDTEDGNTIYFAFFYDPDGNGIGIRQNKFSSPEKYKETSKRCATIF
jgi:predicted lactoylglutathione lyase